MNDTALLIMFFTNLGIECIGGVNSIEGSIISRDILLDKSKYERARSFLPKLKEVFSSSYMTSLQNDIEHKQRWPLINLVRQILKQYGYNLIPKRLSDGYTKEGKKKFRRIFIISKVKV